MNTQMEETVPMSIHATTEELNPEVQTVKTLQVRFPNGVVR